MQLFESLVDCQSSVDHRGMCSTSIVATFFRHCYQECLSPTGDSAGFHHDENTLRAALQSFRLDSARKAVSSDWMPAFPAALVDHELGAVRWIQPLNTEQRQASY